MHRIIQKSIVASGVYAAPGNGSIDFNVPSSYRSKWVLVLDDLRKLPMEGLGFSSGRRTDGNALFVPTVGDWIYFEDGPRVFQFKQVVEVSGDAVHLSNGECCSASGMYGSVIAKKGDYIVRKTDGLCVVRKRLFEEQNSSLIAYMKEALEREKKQPPKIAPPAPAASRNGAGNG